MNDEKSKELKTRVTVDLPERQIKLIDILKQEYGTRTRGATLIFLLDELLKEEAVQES